MNYFIGADVPPKYNFRPIYMQISKTSKVLAQH